MNWEGKGNCRELSGKRGLKKIKGGIRGNKEKQGKKTTISVCLKVKE